MVIAAAVELDTAAAAGGIESIAPLYGLCIPMKGTASVVDFPSGSGVGILSGYTPVDDSELTKLIKERNGVIFGVTNVPEFAAGWVTANPASGHTRNPYSHRLTVGGSSGGSASAVASYMCPLAVTEDTGGSTRVPASSNQNFGFDPSRNHYPNAGNPGMSFTNDQLGVNARSIQDIILYDKALTAFSAEEAEIAAIHKAAVAAVDARALSSITIGTPLYPFVEWTIPAGLNGGSNEGAGWAANTDVREKLTQAAAALQSAGFTLAREEWPQQYFDYLGREENVLLEACWSGELVNGKMMDVDGIYTFGGQISQFVKDYFDAPVSLKEIATDMSRAGKSHDPGGLSGVRDKLAGDETQYRYFMSHLEKKVAAYNSYFDRHGVDLIMIPDAMCATPDLCTLAAGSCPRTRLPSGQVELSGSSSEIYSLHSSTLKEIHIPKLVIPTGLTVDGRPSSVQVWGRAVDYDSMFENSASVRNDVEFLYIVEKVAAAIQAQPGLHRRDAVLASDVVAALDAPKL